MADQSDVEQSLAAIVAGVLYPDGPAHPSAVGAPCRVFRGWPDQASLDGDLLAARIDVTINADPRLQQTTTRFPDRWAPTRVAIPALLVSVSGNAASFSGTAAPGQIAGILVAQVAAVHRTVAGDTPSSVAAALARALAITTAPLGRTTARDGVVTVPDVPEIVARVAADQPSVRETRRQLQAFRVTCWCPSPELRDAAASAIDGALSAMDFLGLPDGMAGRLRYVGSYARDQARAAELYRRDLIYSVDYATTIRADLPRLLFGDTHTFANGSATHSFLS